MNSKIKVGIINMQSNNLFSLCNALKEAGYKTSIIVESKNLISYDIIVLPGVGSFDRAIHYLKKNNFDKEILEFLNKKNKAIFGICLGMQLLFESSEEFGFHKGLELIKGKVKKFRRGKDRIPHIGWNNISIKKDKLHLIDKSISKYKYYFAHSYYCDPSNKDEILSHTNYSGINFCSSILRKNIFGTQYHPEKSGKYGLKILKKIKNLI